MSTIVIELTPEAKAVLAGFQTVPVRVLEKMRSAMDDANQLVIGKMSKARFTGRGPFPSGEHRLGIRTHHLYQSIRNSAARISGNTIRSAIGSNIVYAGVHEFGSTASGTSTVRSFTRKQPSRDVRSPRGPRGGKLKVTTKGTVTVRSFTRRWKHNIPARAPFRTGIEENLEIYRDKLSAAVIEAFKEEGG
jgi:hypothetical protein